MNSINDVKDMIKRHEGYRSKVYIDTVGKRTIGYGHNIDANPTYIHNGETIQIGNKITKAEADSILEYDIGVCLSEVGLLQLRFDELCHERQCVIIDMLFNLGLYRLSCFKRFIYNLRAFNFDVAADEMLDSKWARQVKGRAVELSDIMRKGEFV